MDHRVIHNRRLWQHARVLSFVCPRCHLEASDHFYGPCGPCRQGLRAEQGHTPAGSVTEAVYEPKMNVTPNAVASKD